MVKNSIPQKFPGCKPTSVSQGGREDGPNGGISFIPNISENFHKKQRKFS
jgi:hypothetical protein